MKRRAVMVLLVSSILVMAVGCGNSSDNKTKDTTTIQESGQNPVVNEEKSSLDFDQMIADRVDIKNLYDYVDQAIGKAEQSEMDHYIMSLVHQQEDITQLDYNRLNRYAESASDEAEELVDLLEEEVNEPTLENDEIRVTLSVILDRVEQTEEYLEEYPASQGYDLVYGLYRKYIDSAITGGYLLNGENHYAENNVIDRHTKDIYYEFAEDHKDLAAGEVVLAYYDLLKSVNGKINDEVVNFYNNIGKVIENHYPARS